jgi:predicted phosphoadenosine phosphosulfate sulfurtransferase
MRLVQSFAENLSVLEAAQKRIAFLFDNFESLIVSISGGKDSTVMAHLALEEARKRNRKIGLFLLDEEVLYQSSVDQVEYLMNLYPENTTRIWLQIPFCLTNSTSISDGQLNCWEPGDHKLWMRPKKEFAIKNKPWNPENERFKSGYSWLDFYGVIENFERCYKNTAFLVGLRAAGESPNRWRAVVKNPITINGKRVYWGTKKGENVAMYPIYDWNFHDVWKYIAINDLRYSKIYDFQFKKGYPINEMRVSSLIHERAFKSIVDLPEFEPKTYARLTKRIKGIALAQETGKAAKLFKVSKLPKNFQSWIAYRDFLLATHADDARRPIFEKRFDRQLRNEHVARQQCRQLILNDYENNLPIDNQPDPREALIRYYEENL